MKIYIVGYQVDELTVAVPLSSSVILFLLKYCKAHSFSISIVQGFQGNDEDQAVVNMAIDSLTGLDYRFLDKDSIPVTVSNCILPVIEDGRDLMIRCGLCSVVRHIVKICHELMSKQSDSTLLDLLGFRAASLKACSEVSGWTKLCEVELPESVSKLINIFRTDNSQSTLEIPEDVMKLELHFDSPPPLHNDDKKKRLLLKTVKKELENITDKPEVDKAIVVEMFFESREDEMPHGNVSYRVNTVEEKEAKKFDNTVNGSKCKYGCTENRLIKWCSKCNDREKVRQKEKRQTKNNTRLTEESNNGSVNGKTDVIESEHNVIDKCKPVTSLGNIEELCDYVNGLTLNDIVYEHIYAEGVSFTVADVILFVYIYHLLESLKFQCSRFLHKLPNVKKWLKHILTLPRMQQTSLACGYKMEALMKSVNQELDDDSLPDFKIPALTLVVEENDAEISRSSKAKQKALKKDVSRVLEKVKEQKLNPVIGQHPYGDNVKVDWNSVPLSAHPKIELPEKRVGRKCEQLENLATAVQAIASPGDIIVDFCSGAGHLGIIIAYLLPDCQVYLIENKEESLVRASKRVTQLGLENVTLYQVVLVENNEDALIRASRRVTDLNLSNIALYQCNLDYFNGKFDIGVCLHACGVATDLVLQQCLNMDASFVICPCCYGSIQSTHLISYPRSQRYTDAELNDKDVITLGHAADQTEENTELQQQGQYCMNLVDTDRARLAIENGYSVNLCSLKPLSCTPKNNILIGTKCSPAS